MCPCKSELNPMLVYRLRQFEILHRSGGSERSAPEQNVSCSGRTGYGHLNSCASQIHLRALETKSTGRNFLAFHDFFGTVRLANARRSSCGDPFVLTLYDL